MIVSKIKNCLDIEYLRFLSTPNVHIGIFLCTKNIVMGDFFD